MAAEVSGRGKGKVRRGEGTPPYGAKAKGMQWQGPRGVEDAAPYDKGKEDMRRPEDWPPYESRRQTLITRSTGTRTPTRS